MFDNQRSYDGLTVASSPAEPHLGGSVKGGDPLTFAPSVWDYCIDRFGIGSVLDLGSGSGNAALYFHRKGMKVVAVEGLADSVAAALYPTVQLDLTHGPVVTKVDLVHCQEVVEHIEARFLDNLLTSLTAGRFTLMTHALPGQGGHHHVNEQPVEYWVSHMGARQCSLLVEDTNRIRALAARDGADYLARSGLVFANNRRL